MGSALGRIPRLRSSCERYAWPARLGRPACQASGATTATTDRTATRSGSCAAGVPVLTDTPERIREWFVSSTNSPTRPASSPARWSPPTGPPDPASSAAGCASRSRCRSTARRTKATQLDLPAGHAGDVVGRGHAQTRGILGIGDQDSQLRWRGIEAQVKRRCSGRRAGVASFVAQPQGDQPITGLGRLEPA